MQGGRGKGIPSGLIAIPSGLIAFTIVTHECIPHAHVVAESFLAHHPRCSFYIVVTDYPLQTTLLQNDDRRLIAITEIDFGVEGFEHMATMYDDAEFRSAVKPFVLRHFLRQADCVLYFDPEIEVHAPLDHLVQATCRSSISLTPHCLQPVVRDGREPSEASIMRGGVYNLGYVGVARGAESFLNWWSFRARRDAIRDPAGHVLTDPHWFDQCVPLFRPHIESNPTYNVAYWNLDQRPIRQEAGRYLVNDEPLKFFHFAGFDPKSPHWISAQQPSLPRVLLSDHPVLAALFDDYAAKLGEQADSGSRAPYGWSHAIPGLKLEKEIRRTFRNEAVRADAGLGEMPPTPFRSGGAEDFLEWLRQRDVDGSSPLPRYLNSIWSARPDLQQHMPEVFEGELAALRGWVSTAGIHEYNTLAVLGWPSDTTEGNSPPCHAAGLTERGVNLVGYLDAELGVGESTRLTCSALRASGIAVSTVSTTRTLSRRRAAFEVDNVARYDTVILGVNADQVTTVQRDLGRSFMANRYVIGQWYWELAEFPDTSRGAFEFVDEVWAASNFIRESIAAAAPPSVTVTHMPVPLMTPTCDASYTRRSFGLPGGFMFLFSWDMNSVIERKNPGGLIDAYREAFGPSDGALLVLKTMNGNSNLQALEKLRWACRDRPDIFFIDEVFDQVRSASLANLCDCYVSLHHSEGFGLTLAEAMLLDKPVIATGYSGNLDFTTPDVAHLVRWQPGTVPPDAAPYDEGSTWADPDLGHAAELMLNVSNDPGAARRLGAAAGAKLRENYSMQICGTRMRHRLEEIWSST